jgi:hypothetical protein
MAPTIEKALYPGGRGIGGVEPLREGKSSPRRQPDRAFGIVSYAPIAIGAWRQARRRSLDRAASPLSPWETITTGGDLAFFYPHRFKIRRGDRRAKPCSCRGRTPDRGLRRHTPKDQLFRRHWIGYCTVAPRVCASARVAPAKSVWGRGRLRIHGLFELGWIEQAKTSVPWPIVAGLRSGVGYSFGD